MRIKVFMPIDSSDVIHFSFFRVLHFNVNLVWEPKKEEKKEEKKTP